MEAVWSVKGPADLGPNMGSHLPASEMGCIVKYFYIFKLFACELG